LNRNKKTASIKERLMPKPGKHLITVVDEFGNEAKRRIEIGE